MSGAYNGGKQTHEAWQGQEDGKSAPVNSGDS